MALIRQNVIWIYICNINVYLHCLVLTYLHITFIILIVHVYYISLICMNTIYTYYLFTYLFVKCCTFLDFYMNNALCLFIIYLLLLLDMNSFIYT